MYVWRLNEDCCPYIFMKRNLTPTDLYPINERSDFLSFLIRFIQVIVMTDFFHTMDVTGLSVFELI